MGLYLAVLQFRSPPWAARYKVPGLLESTYIPFDGALSFAVYYLRTLQARGDWRAHYLKDTLTAPIRDMPSGFEASYLLPAQREDESIHFWTPYETRITVALNPPDAYLSGADQASPPLASLSLRLNKRNDLERLLSWQELARRNLSRDPRQALKDRGGIESGRGPYRNAAIEVQVKNVHLLWAAIVEADNRASLEASMQVLEQFGVGKKRSAGWGDLQAFALYDIHASPQSGMRLDCKKLVYGIGDRTYLETVRPLSTQEISRIIRIGYLPLDIRLMQGERRPPYWRKETVVEKAKLLKKVQGRETPCS